MDAAVIRRSRKLNIDIKKAVKEHLPELIELRREFHRMPETGYEEFKTSKRIQEYFTDLGLEFEIITTTGIAAVLNKDADGPMYMFRADIDALDVEEETGVEYASQHPGKMHACGHDAHMATLLIAAKILTKHADQIKGKILFLFQPNEEGAGALNMINTGLFDRYPVEACSAMHVWPYLKTGQFGITEGAVMAGMDHFRITVNGVGGHTGNPHLAADPILTAATIVQALQAVQTREIDLQKPTVLMIGKIESGSAANIIPESAEMLGTVRYLYRMTDEENVKGRMERIVEQVAKAYGMTAGIEWEEGHPAVYNDGEMVKIARAAAMETTDGAAEIVELRSTAGEDFSEFADRVPGVFCHVGTGNEEKETTYSLHHSKFNIDEDALQTMVEMHVRIAMNWFDQR